MNYNTGTKVRQLRKAMRYAKGGDVTKVAYRGEVSDRGEVHINVNFQEIVAQQQMNERNSAYAFFRLPQ